MDLADHLTAAAHVATRRARHARILRHRRALQGLVWAVNNVLASYSKPEIDEQPSLCELRRAAKHAEKILITDSLNHATPP